MKIYLASSWRNPFYFRAMEIIRDNGHYVYDWRGHKDAFSWDQISPLWKDWSMNEYLQALENPIAEKGFEADANALEDCDVCVCLLPCGRSAHLELGYMLGKQKPGIVVLMDSTFEPELMYKLCSKVVKSLDEAVEWLNGQKT